MAQQQSPSIPLQDRAPPDHHTASANRVVKSDTEVPIDPSIAQTSPTYPQQYSPYPQGHDMQQYPQHPPPQMYGPPRDWPGYPSQHGMPAPYQHPASSQAPPNANAGPRTGQVRRDDSAPSPGRAQDADPVL